MKFEIASYGSISVQSAAWAFWAFCKGKEKVERLAIGESAHVIFEAGAGRSSAKVTRIE